MRRRFGRRHIRFAVQHCNGLYESTVNMGQPFRSPFGPVLRDSEKDDTRGISGKVSSFALEDEANKVENENYRDRSINMVRLGEFNEIEGPREESRMLERWIEGIFVNGEKRWERRVPFWKEKDILLDRIVNENFNRNADACI